MMRTNHKKDHVMTHINHFLDYIDTNWIYILKDVLIILLPLTIIWGVGTSFLDSEKIRTGQIPAQTITIDRAWAEPRGINHSVYYALIDGEIMRFEPGVWFGSTTDRDLFLAATPGKNCAVLHRGGIRKINPGSCP